MTNANTSSDEGTTNREDPAEPTTKRPWYRRRGLLVTAAVVIVLAIAVVSDLPNHVSRATELSSDAAVVNEVNDDVAECTYSLKEALAVYAAQQDHTLTKHDASRVPRLLSDDQDACSFTDSSIVDLSDIESPGSPSGKHLNQMISIVTTWMTSDALAAIEHVQELTEHPNDASARTQLRQSELVLASDRAAANAQLQAAAKAVSGRLPALALTLVTPTRS